jgi:hypothetical protein
LSLRFLDVSLGSEHDDYNDDDDDDDETIIMTTKAKKDRSREVFTILRHLARS